MRVLVAPNAFGTSLDAARAAAAIAAGWSRRRPDDRVTTRPVSDGGPGLLDCLAGERRTTVVEDAYGRRVDAEWLVRGDTAVVESAAACGRAGDTQDPLGATTAGVGELVCAALGAGVRHVVVGVGGTASTDGGAGLAQALGAWLLDAAGHPLEPGGGALARLATVGRDDLDPRLADVRVTLAADVDSPLCGPDGAAYGYAPQKGATPEQVVALDGALAHYARVVGHPDGPHAGAGGGLGYGLMAFAGARPGRACRACCSPGRWRPGGGTSPRTASTRRTPSPTSPARSRSRSPRPPSGSRSSPRTSPASGAASPA